MNVLTEHLDAVSGGGAYEVGQTVGVFAGKCLGVIAAAGNMYVPLL